MLLSILLLPLVSLAGAHAAAASPPHQVLARQKPEDFDVSIIPEQCNVQCTTVIAVAEKCKPGATETCPCAQTGIRSIAKCFDCLASPSFGDMNPSVDGFQQLTDGYIAYCGTQGVDLAGTTVSASGASATSTSTADDSSGTSGTNGAFRKSASAGNGIVAAGLSALAFIVFA